MKNGSELSKETISKCESLIKDLENNADKTATIKEFL